MVLFLPISPSHKLSLFLLSSKDKKVFYTNLLDREAGLTDHLGGTARGKKTDILLDQTLGQIKQTCLVIDGDNSCWEGGKRIISMVVGGGPQTTVK